MGRFFYREEAKKTKDAKKEESMAPFASFALFASSR
jgi:hypothetical protein